MSFCPHCDSVLVLPKQAGRDDVPADILICIDCDYVSEDSKGVSNFIIREEIHHDETSKIEVVEITDGLGGISEDIREALQEEYREAMDTMDL